MSGRFLVCIHDATPAYTRETQLIVRDLAPLLGRRFTFGVVPDWCGAWPLTAYPDYCRFVHEAAEERLLHGYFHHRQRGWGVTTLLTARADEMNGLDPEQTRQTLERGQRVLTDVFGAPARGFVAPAWQSGCVRAASANDLGLDYVLGFFSLRSSNGRTVPLATWTWDCGRWAWLGQVGHAVGAVSQSLGRRVPVLAVHPRDLQRGFWPRVMRLTESLLDAGYQPTTAAGLLEAAEC